jgi:ribosomal protein S18 acetylase RimI-like enzyme
LSPSGALYGADENGKLAGVAAWLPPAPAVATRRSRWLEAAASIEVRLLFPRAAPSLLTGFQTLGEHHPPVPHWYLAFVGIEPAQQRRGIGRKLLAPVLERADAGAVACYLETPFPGTRAFYRQLGFEEAGQLQPVAEAPPIWTMTRPPQAGMSSVG